MDEYGYTDFDKDEDVFDEDDDGLLIDGDLLEMLQETDDNSSVKNDADGLDQNDFDDNDDEEDFESL